jgi:tRNA(fMet)-specific endonuclease VapC
VFLFDTNVLSRLVRKPPDTALLEKLRPYPAETLFISCISVMELRRGAARLHNGVALWRRIEQHVLQRFQILGFGMEEALQAGDVSAHLWKAGQPIDLEDVLIGATAKTHGLTVVTNNTAHFRRIPGLAVQDWTA